MERSTGDLPGYSHTLLLSLQSNALPLSWMNQYPGTNFPHPSLDIV